MYLFFNMKDEICTYATHRKHTSLRKNESRSTGKRLALHRTFHQSLIDRQRPSLNKYIDHTHLLNYFPPPVKGKSALLAIFWWHQDGLWLAARTTAHKVQLQLPFIRKTSVKGPLLLNQYIVALFKKKKKRLCQHLNQSPGFIICNNQKSSLFFSSSA